ncbi:MAG: hypothetical protein L0H70_04680 [Xanthomonadales bacterium]|nr:hypothetical protein [Xanthomonadales bacterium]
MLTLDAEHADPFTRAIDSLKRSLDFDADAWVGRDMGGFRIHCLLGGCGMDAVLLAERSTAEFQQWVVFKLLCGRWLEASALKHFADERNKLARLRHPNITSMIDAGAIDDDRPVLVMEYIVGTPSHPAAQDVIRHDVKLYDAAGKLKQAATWRARLIPASASRSGKP